jgi:hypothetical protein
VYAHHMLNRTQLSQSAPDFDDQLVLPSKLNELFCRASGETMSVDRKSIKNGSVTGNDTAESAFLGAHSSCDKTEESLLRNELNAEAAGDSAGDLPTSRAGVLRDENNCHGSHRWFVKRFSDCGATRVFAILLLLVALGAELHRAQHPRELGRQCQ